MRDHCTVTPVWKPVRPRCCGPENPAWPVFAFDKGFRVTTPCGKRDPVDLSDPATLTRLGIAQMLNAKAKYLQREPGRLPMRIHLWQREH
eukprot:6904054-Prymnesium_polylepis.1